jgi:hypothetical protein
MARSDSNRPAARQKSHQRILGPLAEACQHCVTPQYPVAAEVLAGAVQRDAGAVRQRQVESPLQSHHSKSEILLRRAGNADGSALP